MLESIYALLETFGYEVLMSHKGTVPVDPDESAMDSCLDAVRDCGLFLGLILPWYGTGKETQAGLSITHREMIESIALNRPRWFLSDARVIDMFELAMRHDVPDVKDRKGNWVQQYGPEEDARLFATAQFRRYRD